MVTLWWYGEPTDWNPYYCIAPERELGLHGALPDPGSCYTVSRGMLAAKKSPSDLFLLPIPALWTNQMTLPPYKAVRCLAYSPWPHSPSPPKVLRHPIYPPAAPERGTPGQPHPASSQVALPKQNSPLKSSGSNWVPILSPGKLPGSPTWVIGMLRL
jgi:hypothetical protein